jgi:hypothetical protein
MVGLRVQVAVRTFAGNKRDRSVTESPYHRIVGFDVTPIQPHSVMLRLDYVISADEAGEFVTDPEVHQMQVIMEPDLVASIAEKLFMVAVTVKGPPRIARKPN